MGITYTDNIAALPATSASVTAANAGVFDVSKRQLKSIQFVATGQGGGGGNSGTFGIQVSNDGTAGGPVTWVEYNRLIPNNSGTNAQTDAYQPNPSLTTNTSAIFFFPIGDYFKWIRVYCTVVSSGTYSAWLEVAG